jgi:hypothetical protein
VLDAPADLVAVRERVRAAGVEVEESEGAGFLVRDPWDIAALFTRNSRRRWTSVNTPSTRLGE